VRRISLALICFSVAASSSCYRRPAQSSHSNVASEVVIQAPPEGTEKYCWVEPKVIEEKNGPGVDPRGEWYTAPHTAVREVKQGSWKPCTEVGSR